MKTIHHDLKTNPNPSSTDEIIALYQSQQPTALNVIWSDPWIIAINKPANELSVPGKPPLDQHATVLRVAKQYGPVFVIHRLDGATSGIILFARNGWIQRQMHAIFRERYVQKSYCALVEGQVKADCGSIDLPLGPDWPNRPRQQLDWQHGKASLTHWQKLDCEPHHDYTRLKLKPVTGRSHQIRVHLQAIGHPIVGDRLYHPQFLTSTANRQLMPRLHLHAEWINFNHPITGQRMQLTAPCPY